jgi:O-antigen ligase
MDDVRDVREGRPRGAGGTPGGLGEFFLGVALAAAGGYLLTSQVTVTSGFWQLWGHNTFGLSLLPLLVGIAVLFFNGRSVLGWLLTVVGAAIIFVGVLVHLQIFFRPTSLFNTLMMLGLLAAGLGLVARSLRPH